MGRRPEGPAQGHVGVSPEQSRIPKGPRLQAHGTGEAGLRNLAGPWPSTSPLPPPAAPQQPCRPVLRAASHFSCCHPGQSQAGGTAFTGTWRFPPQLLPTCFQFQALKLRVKVPHPQRNSSSGQRSPRNGTWWPWSTPCCAGPSTAGRSGCLQDTGLGLAPEQDTLRRCFQRAV